MLEDMWKLNYVPGILLVSALASCALVSCEKPLEEKSDGWESVSLPQLVDIFSSLRMEPEHLAEVHSAVLSSMEHGYDEEYTMASIFDSPGSGVGSSASVTKAGGEKWKNPLRDLLKDHIAGAMSTKAAGMSPDEYIGMLTSSDVQIYWPYSESWDGSSYPVITCDPGDNSSSNVGYGLNADGSVEEVLVTEEMAMNRPVWVINTNDDQEYKTLEMLLEENPDWGSGGSINIKPTKSSKSGLRTLVMKDFTMKRNYDNWFAGASEFFVKTGAIEDFTASTEAELKLYSPTITDFMVVVRRYETNFKKPFNTVLVSEWTDQFESMAFMITEDDGGTRTSWSCSATVKVQSKSYGFDISLPFNTHDDIVWRGNLKRNYFESYNDVVGHFGDVDITFHIVEQ